MNTSSKDIFEAIGNLDLAAVNSFISSGVDVNALCTEGENKGAPPLLIAVLRNSWKARDIITALIKAGAKMNDIVTAETGWTVLHYAANLNITPALFMLLTAGVDPNIKDTVGRTPLHYCGQTANSLLMYPLIFGGADPTIEANDGHTAATYAALQGGIEIGDIYMTLQKNYEAKKELFNFFTAIMHGDIAAFDAHVDAFAKESLEYGETALMVAAMADRKEMAEKLIEKGADVNAVNDKGKYTNHFNALEWAALSAHPEMVKLLVSKGAQVDSQDNIGNTPIMNAIVTNNDEKTVQALIDAGANVNTKNSYGESVLYFAVAGNSRDVVAKLISKGADLTSLTNDGGPLTHSAARTGEPLIIEDIVKAGVDLKAAGPDGWQGIHVACEAGNLEALKMFLKLGADPQAKTNDGQTPLDIATNGGFDELVQVLSA